MEAMSILCNVVHSKQTASILHFKMPKQILEQIQ